VQVQPPLLHITPAGQKVPGAPQGTCAKLHDWQLPVHALSQHSPCAQKPEAHALVDEQPCPFFSLHAAEPSHVLLPVQLSRSSALVTPVHVPGVAAQVSQVPLHAVAQQ
jgi:hypothetical protein